MDHNLWSVDELTENQLNARPDLDSRNQSNGVNYLTLNFYKSRQGQANGVPFDQKPKLCRNRDEQTLYSLTQTLLESAKTFKTSFLADFRRESEKKLTLK